MSDLNTAPISDSELREVYYTMGKGQLIEILIKKHHEVRDAVAYLRPSFLPIEEDYKTIDEEIYTYFVCMFGEDVTSEHLINYERFGDYCEHHGYTRNFVLRAVDNKGKS